MQLIAIWIYGDGNNTVCTIELQWMSWFCVSEQTCLMSTDMRVYVTFCLWRNQELCCGNPFLNLLKPPKIMLVLLDTL